MTEETQEPEPTEDTGKGRWKKRKELTARRKMVGHTQTELGELIGASMQTVSNWERGKANPGPAYRQPLADVLGVSLYELDRLLGLSPPLDVTGHTIEPWLSHYESLAGAAGRIDMIEQVVVPGYLQIEPYATAVERAEPGATADQIAKRVAARLERQQVLHRVANPPKLTVVINETVLWKRTGGSEVMGGQLDHLVQISQSRPNIDIRMLLADGRDSCIPSSFELLTKPGDTMPFMAVTGDECGAWYHEGPRLKPFLEKWAHLTGIIMSPRESIEAIRAIRERLT